MKCFLTMPWKRKRQRVCQVMLYGKCEQKNWTSSEKLFRRERILYRVHVCTLCPCQQMGLTKVTNVAKNLEWLNVCTPSSHKKITLLVREGATSTQEVRRALREYAWSGLKENCPSPTNRSYFPTLEDIRNHIYTAKQGSEFSKLDQDNLSTKIKN